MRVKIIQFILFYALFHSMIGCSAKVAPPLKDITNAKMALANAKDADAQNLAPQSFKLAQKHYEDLKSFMDKKEYKKAKYSAQKAYIKAKLAHTKANKAKIKKRVDKLSADVGWL